MIVLYDSLEWTTGDASGGSGGFGGTVARAGINAGDGVHSITLPASGNQQAMLSLTAASNLDQPGVFVLSDRASLYTIVGGNNLGARDDGGETTSFQTPFYGSAYTSAFVRHSTTVHSLCSCFVTQRLQGCSMFFLGTPDTHYARTT